MRLENVLQENAYGNMRRYRELSKPKYKWWGYVRWMVREYPRYRELLSDIKEVNVSPVLSHEPRRKNIITDPTSRAALLSLPPTAQKEYDAVEKALNDADERVIKMIDLVYWKKTHTVIGAGKTVFLEEAQAKRLHKEFIYSIARNYGLLSPEKEKIKKHDTAEPK